MNRLYVTGIGPGNYQHMTMEAEEVLRDSEVIAGYTVYIDLLREHFSDKTYLATGMRQERERCILALKEAEAGRTTALVCSGDAGVYGMAGLVLELAEEYPSVEIQVIAGVTAALSGAALLGAPLGHDFSVISLSDLLTPWEEIEARLEHAAISDMAVCLYNPASRKRRDYLRRACQILLKYRREDTVCGYVKNIARTGEESRVLTLAELREAEADMFTTVFIGNSRTKKIGRRMVTPRGYRIGESTCR